MRAFSILSRSVLLSLFAASACIVSGDDPDGEVDTESSAIFTGIRVPGLVMGLQHSQNVGPGTVMFSGLASEATHRRGGDLGAGRHHGFEWWQLHDTGGDPAALRLPPGVVVALKHSANQSSQTITSFGRNPVNGSDFAGFKRMNGGDLGASNGVGYYWFESTGAGFTNWSAVDAMLPKYTVVGLKHALNQPTKVLVWNGVTYDPAKSWVAPPGFRRVAGGDRREGGNEGYYWFEKTTGEEIATQPTMTHRLPQSLRMAAGSNASVVDKDGDCLVDDMEAALAARFRPHITFDSDESARRDGEPVTVWRMYPTSGGGIHIRWLFLMDKDGGYGPESWCDDWHPGDNDHADYDLTTSDGGFTWRVNRIGLTGGPYVWPTNTRLEVHEKFHPKFYFSASKHHEYFNRDNDEYSSPYSTWDGPACEDDVNGAGATVLVNDRSFFPLASNNVGEPNRHADFVDTLPMFGNQRVWDLDNCFVHFEPWIGDNLCISNASKLVDGASQLPAPASLCSIPTQASGFVWAGGSPSGASPVTSGYSHNSTGGTNTHTPTGTGTYRVDFPGLGLEYGGNVQVTAYGSGSERCKVNSWGASGGTLSAYVSCFNAAGAPANTLFTASYVKRGGANPSSPGGYLWADQPYSSSYTPFGMYSWNSSGAQNSIQRYGTGNYYATFPGINVNGGTVEVTAYGWDNAHCKVLGWGNNGVSVGCFAPSGAPVDSMFTLNFAEKSTHDTPSYAYAWADQQYAASYTPSTYYQRNYRSCANGPAITMRRGSTGRYSATIPGLPATGSTVHVTAYSGSSEACKVVGWFGVGDGTQVDVACHDVSGNPADTRFVIVYSSTYAPIC
jgi:hypothetical protein